MVVSEKIRIFVPSKQNYDATKRLLIYILLSTIGLTGNAQTNYDYDHLQRERLNRGVVAVKTADEHRRLGLCLRYDKFLHIRVL